MSVNKIRNKFFQNKTVLITGGTGSLGKAILNFFLKNNIPIKKIIIFSRDELKQLEMQDALDNNLLKKIRFFIGDIRDKDRLKTAFNGVDYVIHAAALKQVPTAEYNPFEFIKTNIIGTENVVQACLENEVERAILISTDKASSPVNLYGATKLCADKLFISANNIKGNKDIRFSVVRYGNVMGSRGSVLHKFYEQKKNGILFLTDKNMTRFNITLDEAIEVIIWSLQNCLGGEIVVPKLSSFYVKDLAKAVSPKSKIRIIGVRPGEKIHEEMVSIFDAANTIENNKYYIILQNYLIEKYKVNNKTNKAVNKFFFYRSDTNKQFLSIDNLNKIISNFKLI
jgi:UDP-N-acetylglucosamine 4,6-dehydratase (inverting)